MTTQEASDLQGKIMTACRQCQRSNPTWTFSMCYSEVQREHPDWFEDRDATRDANDAAHEQALRERQALQDQRQKASLALNVESGDSPTLKLAKKLTAKQIQQDISDFCSEIMRSNPALPFHEAYNRAKDEHPEWFREVADA